MEIDFTEYWFMEEFDILKSLTYNQKVDVINMSCRTEFKCNDIIYDTNEKANRLYFLKKGTVKVSKYSDCGKEMIVDILKVGDIFGEASVFGDGSGNYSEVVEIMEDALTCSLSINDVRQLLIENFDFSLAINELIGNKYKKIQYRLETLFFKKAPERIKSFIKEITDEYGKKLANNEEYEVKMKLTHNDIAKLTATTRQTVTTNMNKLVKNGVLIYDRNRILIKKYDALS